MSKKPKPASLAPFDPRGIWRDNCLPTSWAGAEWRPLAGHRCVRCEGSRFAPTGGGGGWTCVLCHPGGLAAEIVDTVP